MKSKCRFGVACVGRLDPGSHRVEAPSLRFQMASSHNSEFQNKQRGLYREFECLFFRLQAGPRMAPAGGNHPPDARVSRGISERAIKFGGMVTRAACACRAPTFVDCSEDDGWAARV